MAAAVVWGAGLWLTFGKRMPPQIPLLYSRPWGESQLVRPETLLVIPVISLVIGLFLGWGAERIKKEILLSEILLATSAVASVVLTLGMLRVVWIVV